MEYAHCFLECGLYSGVIQLRGLPPKSGFRRIFAYSPLVGAELGFLGPTFFCRSFFTVADFRSVLG